MIVAIDFDDTLTKDASFSRGLVDLIENHGHTAYCVTARRRTDSNVELIESWMASNLISIPVFYTALSSKTEYMAKLGHRIDIWIDDDPKKCAMGH